MKETTQQYMDRIQAYIKGKDPMKIQKSTPKKLQKAVKHLTKKQMKRRPAAGKWSIAEILAHLADAEIVASWRLRQILSTNGTPIQGFDQEVWAETFIYGDRNANESLKVFRVLRENNLSLLKTVPRKLWDNHGVHSERGKETVGRVVQMFAGHDVNHLRQIEAIAKGLRK